MLLTETSVWYPSTVENIFGGWSRNRRDDITPSKVSQPGY